MDPITIAMGLAQFAPQIVKWVTGNEKAEEIAEKVVDVARTVTGKEDAQEALKAIESNPQAALDFRREVFKNEALILQMLTADVQDARKMQVEALNQDDLFSRRFVYYLATAWSAFAMLYVIGITFVDLPKGSVRFADTILGFILGTVVATILQFFFGSSKGSTFKDEVIKKLVSR